MQIRSTLQSLPMPVLASHCQSISAAPRLRDSFTFSDKQGPRVALGTAVGAAVGAFAGLTSGVLPGVMGSATTAIPGVAIGFMGGAAVGDAVFQDEYRMLTVAGIGATIGGFGGVLGGYALGYSSPTLFRVLALAVAGGATGMILTAD
ncbi:MAG: hypothetical protein KC800_22730 [Candidatus Eremiobacteraeota bacterium]|nr:hypothetical protein [Candidatus Eremiobacteraeota bacterium]